MCFFVVLGPKIAIVRAWFEPGFMGVIATATFMGLLHSMFQPQTTLTFVKVNFQSPTKSDEKVRQRPFVLCPIGAFPRRARDRV
jgi:hypothetical protein